jgi:hypothetical protein
MVILNTPAAIKGLQLLGVSSIVVVAVIILIGVLALSSSTFREELKQDWIRKHK